MLLLIYPHCPRQYFICLDCLTQRFNLLVRLFSCNTHPNVHQDKCKNSIETAHHQSSTKHLPVHSAAGRSSKMLQNSFFQWDLCAQSEGATYSSVLAGILISTLSLIFQIHPNTCSVDINVNTVFITNQSVPFPKPYRVYTTCVNKQDTDNLLLCAAGVNCGQYPDLILWTCLECICESSTNTIP